jgi:hypothetical protein
MTRDEYAQAWRAGRDAAAKLVRKHLAYNSQRAVSWHEVQDCAEAIAALAPATPSETAEHKAAVDELAAELQAEVGHDRPDGTRCTYLAEGACNKCGAVGLPSWASEPPATPPAATCPTNPDGQHRAWHDDGAFTHCKCGKLLDESESPAATCDVCKGDGRLLHGNSVWPCTACRGRAGGGR